MEAIQAYDTASSPGLQYTRGAYPLSADYMQALDEPYLMRFVELPNEVSVLVERDSQ